MFAYLKKYWSLICCIAFALLFFSVYFSTTRINENRLLVQFQKNFISLERDLYEHTAKLEKILHQTKGDSLISTRSNSDYFVHLYKNDTLIYWNTNQVPTQDVNPHFLKADGVYRLHNGWYYVTIKNVKNLTLFTYLPIKKEYRYENEILKNELNPQFGIKQNTYISSENLPGKAVFSSSSTPLLSIEFIQDDKLDTFTDITLFTCYLFLIAFIFIYLFQIQRNSQNPYLLVGINLGILLTFYLSLHYEWTFFLSNLEAFKPEIYGSSELFPNFGNYLINTIAIVYFVVLTCHLLRRIKNSKIQVSLSLILLFLSPIYLTLLDKLFHGLVENSSIPLEIDHLSSLNHYSILSIISIGVYLFSYFYIIYNGIIHIKQRLSTKYLVLIIASISLVFCAIQIYQSNEFILYIWLILLHFSILAFTLSSANHLNLLFALSSLLLVAIYTSVSLKFNSNEKEREERIIYANQLASDKDISTEIEYLKFKGTLENDLFLKRVLARDQIVSSTLVKEMLDRKYFSDFWERYDTEFFLFDPEKNLRSTSTNSSIKAYTDLENLINEHAIKTDFDSTLYFVKDYTSQYSYIFELPIKSEDSLRGSGILVGALRSKKIPENIGFPKILISDNAQSMSSLESYSIAKYYDGKLVYAKGLFSYPSRSWSLIREEASSPESAFWTSDSYTHYYLKKTQLDTVVISKLKQSTLSDITSISILFCCFGIMTFLIIILWHGRQIIHLSTISLSIRIQVIVLLIIILSLIAYSWGSSIFVSRQYYTYANQLIQDKIRSVVIESQQELGEEKELKRQLNSIITEKFVQKVANVYTTDVNIFDKNGFLLASSRPKIYSLGLLSTQINPQAINQLNKLKKSEYIHQENIGNLDYSAAYAPMYNNKGQLLAYLNLQYFGQQEGYQRQIQEFIIAIINVFAILLTSSTILALLLSNWVTSPLRILQKSFAQVQFGKYNQAIQYQADDEIGALVKDYNQKLEELAFVAQQLAISERESAWREMAKQVAHEIKNPLTPMKLSLQHLQRIYDPNDPDAKQKLNKVATSLIEQIDALATIANEFSNFAKMPRSNEQHVDLTAIIENVILLFKTEEEVEINFTSPKEPFLIYADKDLLLRVFNNLIKNAIQAKKEQQAIKVSISIERSESKYFIAIQDEGMGIDLDARQRLFTPYFTTKSTGTGLGLAMVKQIIEMYGGHISFESELHIGTTFYIELPYQNVN